MKDFVEVQSNFLKSEEIKIMDKIGIFMDAGDSRKA